MNAPSYTYIIKKRCTQKITTFYRNVSKKYKHTYSEELMHKNADDAFNSIYQIEHTLLRRKPTLSRWSNYHMANTDKWYFAYTIDGDTITIVDACHAQNMHESRRQALKKDMTPEQLYSLISEEIDEIYANG